MVESDHGYICKFSGILAVCVAPVLCQFYAINPFEVSSLAPVVFGLGTIAIHYASFFYALYPLQLVLAPWWLDPLMWVGHVLLFSVYAKVLLADPGVIPACDRNDGRQKDEADEMIVQLAENGMELFGGGGDTFDLSVRNDLVGRLSAADINTYRLPPIRRC